MFPLASHIDFSATASLAIATLLGLGFGIALERAGFGSARRLTAVFYLYDMAVVKVMFTAIVTAMTGIAVLAGIGALDLAELYVEPTLLSAQLIGGLVFGAGFIIGGYCPGTTIAAMASGRKDGFAFAAGMLAGVMAYAELTPGIEPWIRSNATADLTLPSVTGIAMGWWTLGFIGFLVFAAWGMGRLERAFAHLRPRG
jgi:uncharacterized membrane protein YedE/YeeE